MSTAKKSKRSQSARHVVEEISRRSDRWPAILLAAAGAMLFYPPLLGGLFGDHRMFISHIITASVFTLVWADRVRRHDLTLVRTPLDWAILAYAAAYLLSLTGAVHSGEAVYGFMKALNYFMVYWIASRVIKEYEQVRLILKVLLGAGLSVAMVGIMAAAGIVNYTGAYFNGHIMSTLQYHNTMAAYLSVLILLGVTMMLREKHRWIKLAYGAANYIMMVAVLGAISKGAWIILIGGAILLLIGMPGAARFKSLYYLGAAIGPALVINSPFMEAIASTAPAASLLYTGVGLLLALACLGLWEGIEKLLAKLRWSPAVVIAIAVLLSAAVLVLASQVTLPDNISQEISELADRGDASYITRLDFMRWAVDIGLDHPLTGTGAGGWEALYRQYQHYAFWTTEVHNHFLQVGVEAGIIGLGAFIGIWLVLLYYAFMLYRLSREQEDKDNWILAWGITAGCLALGAHAAFDFDLSIPAVCMILWTLLAMVGVLYDQQLPPKSAQPVPGPYNWLQVGVAVIMVMILLFGGGRYLQAYSQSKQGQEAIKTWESASGSSEKMAALNEASLHFTAAVKSDPRNGRYWSNLAGIHGTFFKLLIEQQHPQANLYRQQSMQAMEKAALLRPYDPDMLDSLVQTAGGIGDLDGLIEYGWLAVKTRPNDPGVYKKIGGLWWEAVEESKKAGQNDMAVKFAEEIIKLNQSLQQQLTRVDADSPFWQNGRLKMTPAQEKLSVQAKEFLDDNS